jgi:hypothetical protein
MDSTEKLLSNIDDDIAACRAWGHRWPSKNLRPGRKLPIGFQPRAAPGGCVEVTERCPDCGKKRITVTLPEGVFNRDVVRSYIDPKNWVVVKQEEHATPRVFQAEIYRRMNEEIMAEAARNPVPEFDDE